MMETNIKILYAIKTTKKYKDRIDSILETWLKGIDDYIFYSDHEDADKNVIRASDDSSYLSGTLSKTLWFFNNLKNIFVSDDISILDDYDWIFFVDDDTFVNVKNTQNFLENSDPDCVYGYMFTPQKNPSNPIWNLYRNILTDRDSYPSGGAGFLVSTQTLKKIDSFDDCEMIFDDATIGVNFLRNNIKLVDSDLFNPDSPEFYEKPDEDILNVITYHHVTPDRMLNINKFLIDS